MSDHSVVHSFKLRRVKIVFAFTLTTTQCEKKVNGRCIGIKWQMDEMADGHLGLNGHLWLA